MQPPGAALNAAQMAGQLGQGVTLGDMVASVLAVALAVSLAAELGDALADADRVGVVVGLQASQQAPGEVELPVHAQFVGGQSTKLHSAPPHTPGRRESARWSSAVRRRRSLRQE